MIPMWQPIKKVFLLKMNFLRLGLSAEHPRDLQTMRTNTPIADNGNRRPEKCLPPFTELFHERIIIKIPEIPSHAIPDAARRAPRHSAVNDNCKVLFAILEGIAASSVPVTYCRMELDELQLP